MHIRPIQFTSSLIGYPPFQGEELPVNNVVSRIEAWEDFFGMYENRNVQFYHYGVQALGNLFRQHDLIVSQTGHELELSFDFWRELFSCDRHFVFVNERATRKFLALSILFGKYPGMFLKSPRASFRKINTTISEQEVVNLAQNVMVKYEVPHFFLWNLEALDSSEAELLMEILKGRNLRKHALFPFPLTSSEFVQMYQLNAAFFRYDDHLFVRAAILQRMKQVTENDALISCFTHASPAFIMRPVRYARDIDFWQKAFALLLQEWAPEQGIQLTDCVDYLQYMRYEEAGYTLQGRTPRSLMRAINEWHHEVQDLHHERYLSYFWEKTQDKELSFMVGKKTYRCIQLNSGRALQEEGKIMKNCVVTYTPFCMQGGCIIWSLQEVHQEGKYKPILTIEEWSGSILQARKKFNALPDKHLLKVLHNWASRMDFKVLLTKNE